MNLKSWFAPGLGIILLLVFLLIPPIDPLTTKGMKKARNVDSLRKQYRNNKHEDNVIKSFYYWMKSFECMNEGVGLLPMENVYTLEEFKRVVRKKENLKDYVEMPEEYYTPLAKKNMAKEVDMIQNGVENYGIRLIILDNIWNGEQHWNGSDDQKGNRYIFLVNAVAFPVRES